MPHKVFWTEPTEFVELRLRRFRLSNEVPVDKCPGPGRYHNAMHSIGKHPVKWGKKESDGKRFLASRDDEAARDDHRWPKKCDHCDYLFTEHDRWDVFQDQIYYRVDTKEEISRKHPPVGMMYNCWWMSRDRDVGPDGMALIVILPNGNEWHVDQRASNCDSPCKNCGAPYNTHKHERCAGYENMAHDDPKFWEHYYKESRPHKCWVRHGDPKTGIVTVDKNGVTCGAGAGSISSGSYHGFLQNGFLTDG